MCDDDYPDSYWDIDQWPDEMTRRVPRLSKQDEQRLAEQALQGYQVGDAVTGAIVGRIIAVHPKPVLSLPRKSASK